MNELAAEATRSSLAFAACWDAPEKRSSSASARHTGLVVSIALHVAVLILGAAAWHRQERVQELPSPRVRVTMSSRPQLPAAAPPSAAPTPPAAAPPPQRALPPPRPMTLPRESEPLPEPEPVSAATEPAQPDAGAAVAFAPAGAIAGSVGEASLGGGANGTGSSEAPSAGAGLPPPPALSPERRKLVLDSYLQEIFRSRIAAQFRYPEEAERLGMEGLVVVRVAVLPTGALWSARIIGDCPQRILCAAAERTVRDAAPFPAPPVELGGAISVDVPLQYRLE